MHVMVEMRYWEFYFNFIRNQLVLVMMERRFIIQASHYLSYGNSNSRPIFLNSLALILIIGLRMLILLGISILRGGLIIYIVLLLVAIFRGVTITILIVVFTVIHINPLAERYFFNGENSLVSLVCLHLSYFFKVYSRLLFSFAKNA